MNDALNHTSVKLLALIAFAGLLLGGAAISRAQSPEAIKHRLHDLGGPFIVYRSHVQEELHLTDDQRQKLLAAMPGYLPKDVKTAEAWDKLWVLLKGVLQADQFKRVQQLELQHEGPAALLGRPEIAKELKITDDQRRQFMGIVQDMRQQMGPLMKEAHAGGNRTEIRTKATQIYTDEEAKIEAVLDASQKALWKEQFGKPFDVFNDD